MNAASAVMRQDCYDNKGPAMQILVDADACPVKDEVLRVAERHRVPVIMVSNSWMRRPEHPLVTRLAVGNHPDAADDLIAEKAGPRDVVITADIPLAARVIAKGARVLRPNGQPLDENAIGMTLALRNLHTHLRDTGEITGGPSAFKPQDRSRFLSALDTMVQAALRQET